MNSITHEKNKGRESLFALQDDTLYLCEGDYAASYDCKNPDVVRITLTNVFIRDYRTDITYPEIPVVGFAEHINFIRKRKNLEYLKLEEGNRLYFVCKKESYSSKHQPDVDRVSLKCYIDVNVLKEIKTIEKRVRTLRSQYPFITQEEREQRITRTLTMISRLTNVSKEYFFVAWITRAEFQMRLALAQELLRKLKVMMKDSTDVNPLDTLINDSVSYLESK